MKGKKKPKTTSAELLDLSGRIPCKRNLSEKLHRVRQKSGEMCCQEGGGMSNIWKEVGRYDNEYESSEKNKSIKIEA